ncbi:MULTISPECIES: 3-methyl-2-oxobutanoate hydroxymethyltransferase [Mumia]|nr:MULTISPECIES: 3-methyl-2-oxobutanoate hydroxymethyltransferase [Mumia]
MSENPSATTGGSPAEEPAPYGTGSRPSAPDAATAPAARKRVRTHTLAQMKARGEKWTMLTAYDQYAAQIFDEAGVHVLLVGDSAANNVYGYESSLPVSVDELIPLVRAVSRSAPHAFVLADLPFGSYQGSPEQAYETAVRFMKEGHAHGVKLEGGAEMAPQIRRLVEGGVPVCAHIGFTPQSEHALGGYRVQGRGDASQKTIDDALAVEEAGAFAVVMEMVPGDVAAEITKRLHISTVGIGAGVETDAQVLVWQDMMGLNAGRLPRFVKKYADLRTTMLDAARAYVSDVESGAFPGEEHTF